MDDPGIEWLEFYSGLTGSDRKRVCRVPSNVRRVIGATTDILHIRLDYVRKSVHKHRLRFAHFPMIEIAVRFGDAYKDSKGVSFFYTDRTVFLGTFFAAIKVTCSGRELWVRTFHRKSTCEQARMARKMVLLREQEE